jgi:hypothetical protein
MLVFIDESGDPGFKIVAGSTPVFALAMIIFDDHAEGARTQAVVARALRRLGVKPEFRFNKCRADLRDQFFEAISDCRFRVRAIVIQKNLIWSHRLRSDVDSFYRFFLKSMMKFDDASLNHATVIIDGSGAREFKRTLAPTFTGTPEEEQSARSSSGNLVQNHFCSWRTCARVQ